MPECDASRDGKRAQEFRVQAAIRPVLWDEFANGLVRRAREAVRLRPDLSQLLRLLVPFQSETEEVRTR